MSFETSYLKAVMEFAERPYSLVVGKAVVLAGWGENVDHEATFGTTASGVLRMRTGDIDIASR